MGNDKLQKLHKMSGLILKPDGKTSKERFFEYLGIPPDDYSDLEFTEEELFHIKRRLQHLSTGSTAAIPLICGGATKCPFADRCEFIKLDKIRKKKDPKTKRITPVGRSCLVELNLVNEWTRLYIEEYQIDEDSFTELGMVRELAEIELMLWRINNNIAKSQNAELIQESIVGIDKEGNALTQIQPNTFFELKERLQSRKSRVIKLMVGDRQEKYKEAAARKTKDSGDPSSVASSLRKEMERVVAQMAKQTMEKQIQQLPSSGTTPDDIIDEVIESKLK